MQPISKKTQQYIIRFGVVVVLIAIGYTIYRFRSNASEVVVAPPTLGTLNADVVDQNGSPLKVSGSAMVGGTPVSLWQDDAGNDQIYATNLAVGEQLFSISSLGGASYQSINSDNEVTESIYIDAGDNFGTIKVQQIEPSYNPSLDYDKEFPVNVSVGLTKNEYNASVNHSLSATNPTVSPGDQVNVSVDAKSLGSPDNLQSNPALYSRFSCHKPDTDPEQSGWSLQTTTRKDDKFTGKVNVPSNFFQTSTAGACLQYVVEAKGLDGSSTFYPSDGVNNPKVITINNPKVITINNQDTSVAQYKTEGQILNAATNQTVASASLKFVSNGSVVASATTNLQGRFSASTPAGNYQVQITSSSGALMLTGPTAVSKDRLCDLSLPKTANNCAVIVYVTVPR